MGMGDNEGAKKTKKNPFAPIVNYFKEVKSETKKVVWPTFSQTVKNTAIVIVFVLIVGVIIWVLDLGFGQLRYLTVRQDNEVVEQQQPQDEGEYMTEEQMLEALGITGDELTQYQAMTDEEKSAFIQQKVDELNAAQGGDVSDDANGSSEADSDTGSDADGQ